MEQGVEVVEKVEEVVDEEQHLLLVSSAHGLVGGANPAGHGPLRCCRSFRCADISCSCCCSCCFLLFLLQVAQPLTPEACWVIPTLTLIQL